MCAFLTFHVAAVGESISKANSSGTQAEMETVRRRDEDEGAYANAS